jgi:hypothetical protein
MMKAGHYAVASPIAAGYGWTLLVVAVVPLPVAVVCAALVVRSSTWPDYDHPRFKGRMHPFAALVRGSARIGYAIRTDKDRDREDVHRGPSHCIEWCLLVGAVVALLALQIPPIAPWALWFGAAVTVGCASHIVADLPTPSGVPVSAVYNYLAHGEVWKRHSLRWFSTDSAGEKFLAIPAMYLLTGVMVLAMLGLLGPVVVLLTGWS